MSKLIITITVEGGISTAKITDSMGNEKTIAGLALFGGDSGGDLYTFAWGSPDEAAHSVAEGLSRAIGNGDNWYATMYKALLLQFCIRTGTKADGVKEVSGKQRADEWETMDILNKIDNKLLN